MYLHETFKATADVELQTFQLSTLTVSPGVTRFHCLSHALTVGSSFLTVLQNLVDFLSNSQFSRKTNEATQFPFKKIS